ncbi:MAG: hypothetical protein QNL04_15030 [SAR324 cluster bacterium]|nr:hypothetical protein [SAR324 cluster bacterium]
MYFLHLWLLPWLFIAFYWEIWRAFIAGLAVYFLFGPSISQYEVYHKIEMLGGQQKNWPL